MPHPSESEVRAATILIDVQFQKTPAEEHGASLQELRQLIATLGWDIVGTLTQKLQSPTAASLIGPGKLEELSQLVKAPRQAESVVFDHDLTPTQVRNIREATGVEVYDRPAVILEIFHRHARTKEAQLQVELARLKYLTPRQRVSGAKERRGGGRGARGVSESFHELERRKVRDRTSELLRELKAVHREQIERRRHREGLPKVAIVGYTNAGKSSLMRALTSSEVLVADRLFATLDTTVRALQPETQPRILVSDTVGFIRNLPHDLVASFRSTLDESLDASLLLHIVDAADPAFRSHIEVTKEVLEGIGAGKLPFLLILNKIDVLNSSQKALLEKEFPEAIAMSALNPQDIAALHRRLVTFFLDSMAEVELVVPYGKEGVLADIRKNIHVLSESYEQKGVCLKVKASPGTVTALKRRLA
ncbi:MAG TPA: GTPase HflX [Candidatus Dormibacteraeota bacterium]|nr:GTPase HflX [Candidatus Dormibacteraeota bacterium]